MPCPQAFIIHLHTAFVQISAGLLFRHPSRSSYPHPQSTPYLLYILFFLCLWLILKKKKLMLFIIGCGLCGNVLALIFGHSDPSLYPRLSHVFIHRRNGGRKVGAIRLGEHGRLFHPHPVDKWMGMKKTWKSDSHFCGNRQGQDVQIVVNSWIARWRLIGLALKSCPQCFPRLFNTL